MLITRFVNAMCKLACNPKKEEVYIKREQGPCDPHFSINCQKHIDRTNDKENDRQCNADDNNP